MRFLKYAALAAAGLIVAVATSFAQTTDATNVTDTVFPPGSFLVQSIALLLIFACILTGFRFYKAVRGGRLARGWLWVFFGFVAFACAQLLLFGGQLEVLPLLLIWVDTLRLVSLTLFFIGIGHLRKMLA